MVALFGVYLLLVVKLTWDELAAGAAAVLLATVGLEALHHHSARQYGLRIACLGRLLSLPWTVLKESATILRAAMAKVPPDGLERTIAIPFRSETGMQKRYEAGRRALVVGCISATPNSFVVLSERDPGPVQAGSLLVHQLVRRPPPGKGDPVWPL